MQVSLSTAYARMLERSAQPAGAARQAGEPQRLADMPGAKPVDPATVPALCELRWIADGLPQEMEEVAAATYVEGARKNLQGLRMFRGYMDKSAVGWLDYIDKAESLIARHGPNPSFLAMIENGKSALHALGKEMRAQDAEIDRVTAELEEKMRAPAYQQWLARQAAQSGDASDAQGAGASVADTAPPRLSVVC